MCDDLVPLGNTRLCREYPIEILFCDRCNTAHQRFQIANEELFPRSYHYRARFTADVLNGMKQLVDASVLRFGDVAKKTVLDVGCNDGSLLNFFRERGANTLGIEPTGAASDASANGHTVFNGFLSPALCRSIVSNHGQPDIITFTNVFAHIRDLGEVVESLRILLGPRTRLIIENHYLGTVLDTNQFDTFYHEHPRTYSFTSFLHVFEKLGVGVADVEFPSRYGGNIRVFSGSPQASSGHEDLIGKERRFQDQFARLRDNVDRWRQSKARQIHDHVRRNGKLRAKAFTGRAAILIKLLSLNEDLIVAVHEKPGSMKIGHYVPGTRIPIVSDDELFSLPDQTQPLLNLAWHLQKEIRAYLSGHGYSGPIIDIVEKGDFR